MQGVFTALITPFNDNNKLDLPAFRKILKDQADAGISGVIPCGTTGESPTLSLQERKTLITTAIEELKGSRTQVIAGTGSNNTDETLEFSRWASEAGVAAVMIVTPYYNKPSQAGLFAHYTQVADAVSCEVVAYNVPGRTGVSFTAETLVRLASHPRIRTVKEATGNVAFTSEILDQLKASGQNLDILSGDDATYLPLLSVGARGVISVASNLFPRGMVGIQNAFESGNVKEATRLHRKYYPLFRDLFIESNPVPVKHAMSFAGWCHPRVRLPLAQLSPANESKLNESLKECVTRGKPA